MAGLSLSSSDEELESEPTESKVVNSELKILPQENSGGLDFTKIAECDTLFAEDIDEDDEIFMVSTPLEIDPSLAKNLSIDLNSSTSKLKCKMNNSRTRFKVYRMTNPSSSVNLLLPSRKSKSFRSKTYPVSGKIILQKCPRVSGDKK